MKGNSIQHMMATISKLFSDDKSIAIFDYNYYESSPIIDKPCPPWNKYYSGVAYLARNGIIKHRKGKHFSTFFVRTIYGPYKIVESAEDIYSRWPLIRSKRQRITENYNYHRINVTRTRVCISQFLSSLSLISALLWPMCSPYLLPLFLMLMALLRLRYQLIETVLRRKHCLWFQFFADLPVPSVYELFPH